MASDALSKARAKRAAAAEAGELKKLDPMQRFLENPSSRAAAVKAKCFDCVGLGAEPGWREKIRECPAVKCPLHGFRPYQRGSKEID